MRKKFITMITVCIIAILALSVTASAYYLTGKCGDNVEWGLDLYDSQIDIWGTGDMQNFNLSDKTEMSDRWGGIPSSIKRVDIDEGVTSIGNHAFSICLMLKEVKLPNTLVSIGEDAFGSCSDLEKIEIPEGTKEIGNFAFLMSALKDITIPSTLTKIGLSAFDSNNDLNIHISDIAAWCNVERFGFRGSANNIKTNLYIGDKSATNITIPNGTKRITGGAFWIMSNIKSITIPKSVTEIEEYAFNENITLNVYENSYAHNYAVKNSIPYNIMSYPNTNGNSITISNSQKNGDTVSFTAELSSKEEIQGTIFAAVYDTNGALTNIKSYPAAASKDISITKKDNDYTAKIFWWLDTESMYPIANCTEIKLNEVENAYSINKEYDNTRGSVTVKENGQEITTAAEGKQITIETSPKNGYGVLSTVTDTSGNMIAITNNTFTMPKGDVYIKVVFVRTKDRGTFGINNNLDWLLDDNGTLIISGSGQMEDFTNSNTPWNKYNSNIKIIVIKNGVTRISKNAFADCSKMKRVLIDKNVTEIEAAAFKNCADLSIVEYSGSQSDWEEIYIGADNEQLKNANFIYNSSLSDTAQTDLDYLKYTQNEDNTVTITNCLADAVKINIPKEIGGLPVTTIGENAFSGCGGLTSVIIPNSITRIEDYAFSGCSGLTSVTIPNSVTSIGVCAFSGCSGLTSITIPNSITRIGISAFSGCSRLTGVMIPDSIKYIGDRAFYNCSGLKDVYITNLAVWCNINFGNSYSNPMYYADNLYVNNELLTNLVIPDGVTSIGGYAFSGCSGLTSVTIPNSVTSVGVCAFEDCNNLDSIYITDLAAYLNIDFNINASSNPMYYANRLYLNNKRVTSVEIPDGITEIPNDAFYGCDSITSVTIPNSVTSIGGGAFYKCSGLTDVYYNGNIADFAKISIKWENITLHCTNTTITIIEMGKCGNNAIYYIDKDGTLTINGSGNMQKNNSSSSMPWYNKRSDIKAVVIEDGITSISDWAFYGCDSITSVTIPNSITRIGDSAFSGCSGLSIVYYTGSKEQYNISIGAYNGFFNNAKEVYNYIAE